MTDRLVSVGDDYRFPAPVRAAFETDVQNAIITTLADVPAVAAAAASSATTAAASGAAITASNAAAQAQASAAAALAAAGSLPAAPTVETDNFTALTALPDNYSVLRPNTAGYRIVSSGLQIDTNTGSFAAHTATNAIVRPCAEGVWTVQTRMTLGITAGTQQAGIVLFFNEYNYVSLSRVGRPSSFVRTQFAAVAGGSSRYVSGLDYSDALGSSLSSTVHFRIQSDGVYVTGYQSADGVTWTLVGRPMALSSLIVNKGTTPNGGAPLVGFFGFSDAGTAVVTATFDKLTLTHRGMIANPVQPVDSESMLVGAPSGTMSNTERGILQQSDKYCLNTWYPATYGSQSASPYLDLGGIDESHVRTPAAAAFGLAVSLSTGTYSQAVATSTAAQARAVAVRLVASIAKAHNANRVFGWGLGLVASTNSWQAALWAGLAGHAGWMLWPSLSAADQINVQRMVQAEADRFLAYTPPYYGAPDGTILFPGDSKAEENAWNAYILQLAAAMIPTHPHAGQWMRKHVELTLSGMVTQADVTSPTVIGGAPISDWVRGWNVNADYTLTNHDQIHPDYMCMTMQLLSLTVAAQAGMYGTKAATWNMAKIYRALTDITFAAPPYNAPGGTIYQPGGSNIYYPQGNDWGTNRRMQFAVMDAFCDMFGLDTLSTNKGAYWEGFHLNAVATQQARSTTGQTYTSAGEDTYAGREQWIAMCAGFVVLTRWMFSQRPELLQNPSNLPPTELLAARLPRSF